MSDLIERARDAALEHANFLNVFQAKTAFNMGFNAGWNACAQSERTRIADELEALSQKTSVDAMVTALLEYADGLRGQNEREKQNY